MSNYDRLKGRMVQYRHPKTSGTHFGLVRSVSGGPRVGLRSVLVSGPGNLDGKTLSSRYCGPRVRVPAELVLGVQWRGKMVSVEEFVQ